MRGGDPRIEPTRAAHGTSGRARPRPLRPLLALALAGAALTIPGAAAPPVAEAVGSPDDIIAFVVEGTGHGHGRGMSQWGAYGYAVDHGWTSDQILNHYYGGTEAGTVSTNERIRVRLTDYDGQGTVSVISHQANGVRWNGNSAPAMRAVETSTGVFRIDAANTIACPSSSSMTVPQRNVSFGSSDRSAVEQIQAFLDRFEDDAIVVDGLWGPQTASVLAAWQAGEGLPVDGNNWTSDDWTRAMQVIAASGGSVTWTQIGTHVQSPGSPVRFTTPGGDSGSTSRNSVLGVCSTTGRITHFRGAIEVIDTENGNRVANDVPVEQYLRGVVPKEISASWASAGGGAGRHSVQAQSVAARSYGLSENRTGNSYEYRGSSTRFATTCDTTSCQVYAGSATRSSATGSPTRVEQDLSDVAIAATAGKVRRWPGGAIVRTEFSASNGPRTAGGQFPPVNDIGDDTSRNPSHKWTRIFDADDFAAQHGLGRITSVGTVDAASSTYRQFDGIWFNDVLISGTSGTYREDAWDFRNAYGLLSPGFTIRPITRSNSASSVAFIGDSVGSSIAGSSSSEFQRLTDGTFPTRIIDVVEGRCTTKTACPGSTGVAVANGLPAGLDVAVVELGYNDTVANFASDIDAMMTALNARGVQRVLWVNLADIRTSGGRSVYGPANAALRAAETRWPNLEILDWDAASNVSERVRWFSDGVHLTTTGQAEFALWLRDQLIDVGPSHYVGPGETIRLPIVGETLTSVSGAPLVVPGDAVAAAINVTVVGPTTGGYLTVWPCQEEMPPISSLNYFGGAVRANSVIAPISSAGEICLFSLRGTHVVVDVAGWFDDGFVGIEPERRVDTRNGTGAAAAPIGPSTPLRVPIAGTSAVRSDGTPITIPNDVEAVAINLAAVAPVGGGFLTAWPCGADLPLASNVNYGPGDEISTGVVVPVGADGSICVHTSQLSHVLVDVMGYLPSSSSFEAAIPTRLADTRESGQRLGSQRFLEVPVRGRVVTDPATGAAGLTIPQTATAVVANVVAVGVDFGGFLTVWPCTDPMPLASNVNYQRPGEVIANSVVAPIGPDGSICVFTHAGADVVVDVSGWFVGDDVIPAVPERLVDTRFALGPMPG